MHAAIGEPVGIVSRLLQYDVDVSCRDKSQQTVYDHATISGRAIHYKLITEYGRQKGLYQSHSTLTRSSERAFDPEFTLGAAAMDQIDFTPVLEFQESSQESEESFDKSDSEQEKVTSERVNIPEQTAPGKQVKPLHFPLSYLERKSQGLESNKESNSDSVHLDVESKRAERCEKVRVKEKTMEVKRNFKTVPTEFKQIFGEIYDKDKIADQPTEKLQDEELLDVSEEEIEQLQEASLNLTNSSSDTEKEEKGRGPLSVGVQSFSEQNDYSLQDAVLKLTFPEQVLQSPSNLSSESRNLHHKKGDKSEIECTCDLNEEYVAYDAENIILAGTQTAVNERKEDEAFGRKLAGNLNRNTTTLESDSERLLQSSSVASHCDVWCTSSDDMRSIIQEEKPAFKFNEKTKVKENFLQKRDHNDNNSPNEVRP
ncbi:putative coiled-coil domain-containing protein 144B isoform X2 [Phascolarctos cinereus]